MPAALGQSPSMVTENGMTVYTVMAPAWKQQGQIVTLGIIHDQLDFYFRSGLTHPLGLFFGIVCKYMGDTQHIFQGLRRPCAPRNKPMRTGKNWLIILNMILTTGYKLIVRDQHCFDSKRQMKVFFV